MLASKLTSYCPGIHDFRPKIYFFGHFELWSITSSWEAISGPNLVHHLGSVYLICEQKRKKIECFATENRCPKLHGVRKSMRRPITSIFPLPSTPRWWQSDARENKRKLLELDQLQR